MKSLLITISIFIYLTNYSFSQKTNNNWCFGNLAGINFNGGSPQALTNNSLISFDNNCTVSDFESGDLLFYSNGEKVWNRNHQIMFNGNGLLGSNTGGNSAFAVKKPISAGIYYLFTSDAFAGSNGIRYSVIDMSLDNGLGGVTEIKNTIILNKACEKIAATPHANGKDVWIVFHEWNNNNYRSYLITENGIAENPVISSVGEIHGGGTEGVYNAMGQMSFNLNGSKLACAIYDKDLYEILDFDNSTGILSNQIKITGYPRAWGVEFSTSGRYLYTTTWMGTNGDKIRQFDLISNNETQINQSMNIVGTATSPNSLYKAGYLQLAPDNKIYVAKYESPFLGVINNPDLDYNNCDFQDNGLNLNGKTCRAGLSSFIKENQIPKGIDNPKINLESFVLIYPNPSENFITVSVKNNIKINRLDFYDGIGRFLFSSSKLSLENNVIDISAIDLSYYFVIIDAQNGTITRKLLKLN